MVHIFFVQPGEMKTFEAQISIMQSVADLKEIIKDTIGIPIEQQVLLINGGESLDNQKNLCSYMAGTDTNPIYLFSTSYDIRNLDILKNLTYDDSDLTRRLSECKDLPVSLGTVKTRTLVAQDYFNTAKVQLEFCEATVHEQHLQQQGWSAVIANLEDIITEFKKRWDLFLKMYQDFIGEKSVYDGFLNSFEDVKKMLQRIPVIDTLLDPSKEPLDNSKLSEIAEETDKDISLYEWISSSDSKNSLDDLFELCKTNLHKFEMEIMPSLQNQISETLETAEQSERKEIEGLGKRLSDLEELLRKIKVYVQHQSDMAQSFLQNENRATHIKDLSILPDLCATHLQQLEYIRQYHEKLMGDRGRIIRAKHELSKSLCARIGWVQRVENKLWELDTLLVYFHEHLQRLRKHLEVFQQLHLCPVIYMTAVVEVVRRRLYSQLFLVWSSDLACRQLTIYNEELTRRKEFNAQFEGHFLNALFPGMGDVPPPFAVEAPCMFDAKLPKITEEDMERLKRDVPDLAEILALPDMNHVVNFFMGKSATGTVKDNYEEEKVDNGNAVEEKLIQAVSDVGLASNLDKNLLKATGSEPCLTTTVPGHPDKGCESETDTEEFEKVGQSPLELNFPQGAVAKVADKQDASTLTEDNLQISRSEHEKMKTKLLDLSSIARQAAAQFRADLNNLKSQYLSESQLLSKQYESLSSSWVNMVLEVDRNEKEIVDSMRRQFDTEKDNHTYTIMEKDSVISRLEQDKTVMQDRMEETCRELSRLEEKLAELNRDSSERIEDLMRQIRDKDAEKEVALKELTDNLKLEHKRELDNIKSRLKLMTERSPSLSSLEKEKLGDYPSLSNQTLIMQMTENFELDKERAVLQERERCEKAQEDKIKELEMRFEEEKRVLIEDVAGRVAREKDNQIDVLRERERNLTLENAKLRTTVQQLAEFEAERKNSSVEQVEVLRKENEELKEELQKVLTEKETLLTTSVAVCEGGKIDATTSPLLSSPPTISEMSRSEMSAPIRPRRLNIDTCKMGDVVLVYWDSDHENFKVYQESRHTYFLHSDCLEKLGLSVIDGKPNRSHVTGEVIDKEYCHARKSENRYRVPKGTKFFRVKVKPVAKESRDGSQSLSTSRHSTGMSTSQSVIATFDPLAEEGATSAELRDSGPDCTATNRSDSESGRIDVIDSGAAAAAETHFAEDSGIVEQAMVALEDCDR